MSLESSFEDSCEPMNITDLPEELIKNIFRRMKFVDMIKMYDVDQDCKRICQGILENTFRVFPMVCLEDFDENEKISAGYHNGGVDYLRVIGFSNILRFMRIFHDRITCLVINFFGVSKIRQKILMRFIVENCHDSLTSLTICDLTAGLRFNLIPFTQIEFIDFECCYLGGILTRMSVLFPNVREIKLAGTCYTNRRELANFMRIYRNLEYMRISPTLVDSNFFEVLSRLNSHAFFGFYS